MYTWLHGTDLNKLIVDEITNTEFSLRAFKQISNTGIKERVINCHIRVLKDTNYSQRTIEAGQVRGKLFPEDYAKAVSPIDIII